MKLTTIDQLPIASNRVFIRVDFNVPLNQSGEITDDTRIREALPTICFAVEKTPGCFLLLILAGPKAKSTPLLASGPWPGA